MTRLSPALAALLLATPLAAQDSARALQEAFLEAFRAGDAAALAALYADDATNYTVGEMVVEGREATEAAWAPFFEANTIDEAELIQGGLETLGDAAVGWGLWRIVFTPREGGEQAVKEGRYMDMSRKTDEGWRYVVDHASVRLPPGELRMRRSRWTPSPKTASR